MNTFIGFILAHKVASVIAAIVIIVALYVYFRESPNKHMRKAINYHKKGEIYYNKGDIASAEDFYGAAEYHREKSTELREA
ncbi:hypothetical protein J4468_00770 [Candidatus Woesearchaeota archaeon]|nr:hypothetical protein [Candidatus Woesearchaeota archaeon]